MLPFPSPGDLPDSGMELGSPDLQADSLPSEPPGNPHLHVDIYTKLDIGSSEVKASACNAGDLGSIPGSGRSLEKEMTTHSSILSCLENPMDGGAWWATVHGIAKSRTQLSDFTFTFRNISVSKYSKN